MRVGHIITLIRQYRINIEKGRRLKVLKKDTYGRNTKKAASFP